MDTERVEIDGDGVVIDDIIEALCTRDSLDGVMHPRCNGMPTPSLDKLREVMELVRSILFPGYFGSSDVQLENLRYYIGSSVDKATRIFTEQIKRGFCFFCEEEHSEDCIECEEKSSGITASLIGRLPHIRRLLATDVRAAYEGDPAAGSESETIFCYPSMRAITNFRIAHELYKLEVPLIPRIITEMAHSETGIDIHPGASIGQKFFIDHGTGVVIGETSVIGNNVRLYQGVTLGAKSFPLDKDGKPVKGVPRHPIVEDDVIIYSSTTILGRITIGKGSTIGGNVWVSKDVAPGSTILTSHH